MVRKGEKAHFFEAKRIVTLFKIRPCERKAGAALDLQGNHSPLEREYANALAGAALDLQGNHSQGGKTCQTEKAGAALDLQGNHSSAY